MEIYENKSTQPKPWAWRRTKYLYDPLYRLTTSETGATPPSLLEQYTYGKTGDRTSAALNGGTAATYSYTAGTHRLSSVGSTNRTLDANGNTLSTGAATLTYDDRNRMTTANGTSYAYNGTGERVSKTTGTNTTVFVYGEGGQLVGEYTNGQAQEYVYLDGTPIGVATSGTSSQLYYVETDQLTSPRRVVQPGATTASDTLVWNWDYFGSTFGTNAPNPQTLTVNLRFPGQYFDPETGLSYNYFRDYEPTTGRYVESDPIGQYGGVNTYSYVNSKVLRAYDAIGLIEFNGQFDPDTQSEFSSAIDKVGRLLSKPCGCGGESCYPCELQDELTRKYFESTLSYSFINQINYNPYSGPLTRSQLAPACAYSRPKGTIITVTSSGMAQGYGGCPCYASLILHELLHEAGLLHNPKNDPDDPTDPVWSVQRKCNLCADKPYPWMR